MTSNTPGSMSYSDMGLKTALDPAPKTQSEKPDLRYHGCPFIMKMKTRILLVAFLLACMAALSWSQAPQITVSLRLAPGQNPDTDAKAAQLQIGELLCDPSTRSVLPGPVVKFSAANWSPKLDQGKRKQTLDSLSAQWGDKLKIETAGTDENSGSSGSAKTNDKVAAEEVARKISAAVPARLITGDQGAVYDASFAAGRISGPAVPVPPQSPASKPATAPPLTKPVKSGVDLAAIDRSARQCDDFYQYACGGWIAKNPIPPDQSDWGVGSIVHERNQNILKAILEKASAAAKSKDADEKKLGDIYAACMDQKALEKKGAAPLKPDLKRIDGLSSLKGLAAQIGQLHAKGFGAVFGFGSEQDFEDASMNIAAIDQGGISLPDRDYYLEDSHKDDLKAYGEHAAKMFELAGDTKKQAQTEAAQLVAVETALAKISMDNVSRRDPAKTHAKTALAKFEALTPSFDWNTYFKELGAPKLAEVDVNSMPFFSSLEKILTSTPLAAWKAYLRWQVIHGRATMLSSAFDKESFSFWGQRLSGQKQQKPRWKRCVGQADAVMGEALGRDYVKQAFDGKAKDATLAMVAEIEAAMQDDIKGVTWMSPQTQQKALDKLAEVTNKIGYPDKWRDYSKLNISRTDALGNIDRSASLETKRDMAKIGKKADRKEWGMTPPTVNAYYDPSNNNINFPAGILQPPYYDPNSDDAVNFGAIGAVEGHELTHGFDDQGHQYDGKGNLKNWWTPADQAAFEARSKGLVDQYSKFVVAKDPGGDPKKDVHVNGELTLGENTADNGGIRLAYAAYLKTQAGKPRQTLDGFSPEQRFFLGFAQGWCENQTEQSARLQAFDPHPISRFRVLGTLANMPEFAQAFSCKASDPMVNPTPARVW
ncbi:MAG: M13 family metallopeptidase [Elusimicrobia bacterium]|nr:M13 family metallopeptidase [Elusimicrobiota bacterium]